jgi:hypothetical protein
MQIRWRKNPKTEEGWFKRTAISLLVGVAGFAFGFPVTFFVMAGYLRRANPGGTESLLGAMTAGVVAGFVVGAVGFGGAMLLLWVWSLRGGTAESRDA